MQSVAIRPRRAEVTLLAVGLAALCVAMLVFPILCVPLALMTPLLGCPLVGRRGEPFAWAAALMPAPASLLAGYPLLYSASLTLPGLLTLAITRFLPVKKRDGTAGLGWYTGAVALGLAAILASASLWLGAPLWQTLTERILGAVRSSGHANEILLRCAASGLASMPEGYESLLARLLNPGFLHQIFLSLRLHVQSLLQQGLPALTVQASVVVGLFTALRVRRFNDLMLVVETDASGRRQARVSAPPGFARMPMPRPVRNAALVTVLVSMGLLLSESAFAFTLGQLGCTLFQTVFMLAGAAVVTGLGDEDRRPLMGLLAAVLYVAAPFLLLLLGTTDQIFHFRSGSFPKPD